MDVKKLKNLDVKMDVNLCFLFLVSVEIEHYKMNSKTKSKPRHKNVGNVQTSA